MSAVTIAAIRRQVRAENISCVVFHLARYAPAGFCCEVLPRHKYAPSPVGVTQVQTVHLVLGMLPVIFISVGQCF